MIVSALKQALYYMLVDVDAGQELANLCHPVADCYMEEVRPKEKIDCSSYEEIESSISNKDFLFDINQARCCMPALIDPSGDVSKQCELIASI